MKPGRAIGMTLCIAISSAAGAVAGVVVLLLCPTLVMLFGAAQMVIDDYAPRQSLVATFVMLQIAAVAGVCAGALLAWLRLRGRVQRGWKLRPGTRSA